jgi:hypothetical protein
MPIQISPKTRKKLRPLTYMYVEIDWEFNFLPLALWNVLVLLSHQTTAALWKGREKGKSLNNVIK